MKYISAVIFVVIFLPLLIFANYKFKGSIFRKQAIGIGIIAYISGIISIIFENKTLDILGYIFAIIAFAIGIYGLKKTTETTIGFIVFISSFIILQIIGYAFNFVGVQLVIIEPHGKSFSFASTGIPLLLAFITWLIIKINHKHNPDGNNLY